MGEIPQIGDLVFKDNFVFNDDSLKCFGVIQEIHNEEHYCTITKFNGDRVKGIIKWNGNYWIFQLRKLSIKWKPEIEQELQTFHGMEAETELINILSKQILGIK